MTRPELIDAMATAIATMEGYFKEGSLSHRQNNPGNLRSWGKVPIKNGYCVFYNIEDGWRALKSQIAKNIDRQLTMREFFGGVRDAEGNVVKGKYSGYAPSADKNDPHGYAQYVAARAGVPPDVDLSTLYIA